MGYEAKCPVHLPVGDFLELEFHLMDTQPGVTPDGFVTGLVQRWLAAERERLGLPKDGLSIHGFQWKTLFLPDATRLRTTHRDVIEFAKVTGDKIIADDGASVTPSSFANRHAQGRNAWRAIWLLFPGEEHWIRALDCRAHLDQRRRNQSKRKSGFSRAV